MSERPSFFAALPGEPGPRDNHGDEQTQPVIRRHAAHSDYRRALEGLQENLARFHMYNEDQALRGWIANAKRARTHLDEALQELERQVTEFIDTAYREVDAPVGLAGVVAADKLERWPGETPEEHELRLFKDFGIRIPEKTDPVDTDFPVDTAFFLPKPPDMTLELLTHIRDLLSQLVASQARPAVNLTNISQTLGDDPAKLWARLAGARGFSVPDEATAHETSPSADGCGDRTEEECPVAEAQEAASATAATDTPIGIDTSPLVVHRTAALQDAISARDAVFFRIRDLSAVPPAPYAYERLPELGKELHTAQLLVNRRTAQLEHARAAEVSLGEFGMFSNGRRPGARFSNPTPPAAPETPDAAQ
ncbi:hypothetical protein [Rhodococcus erythropolis]|uniref:hypothetical protein n=1 Tax=Rhodococcus erythropolis TaxID=1833 RepID=UPI000878BEB7|nr:hypothetical protein [Rhodococcus erythropolis]OFV78473.1 hypothetical protein RERY_09800 [Rhodococcus erythropolis]